jgi:4-hydroxybenzoate polyprenyltransferase/phosphoserine phosphatase
MNTVPLCVDMDGTLLKTDTLLELLVRVLKQQPWLLLFLPWWLLRGRVAFKQQVVKRAALSVAALPVNQAFLQFLQEQHRQGRDLYLVTGALQVVAQAVAEHYGLFKAVLATQTVNLTGRNKAVLLVQTFGEQGFDYAGNSAVDAPCWQKARQCYLVNAAPILTTRLRRQFNFTQLFDARSGFSFSLLWQTLRIHQWAKNLLVLAPLLAAHRVLEWPYLQDSLVAFLAFSGCASLAYVINDIADLDADRQHHSKKHRPFACGNVSLPVGLLLAILLALVTVWLSTKLPIGVAYCLLVYFAVTKMYTFFFKQKPIIDVAVLAGLYTLRVIAGGFAAQVVTSFWLLAFSCFIFFSLAIVKRLSELHVIKVTSHNLPTVCRGYHTDDIAVLTGLGTASAMMAVLVLALYINSPDVVALYSSPRYLWLLCPVIALWLGRVWLITGRGQMHDDPVIFALRDRSSWLLFVLAAAFMVLGANI